MNTSELHLNLPCQFEITRKVIEDSTPLDPEENALAIAVRSMLCTEVSVGREEIHTKDLKSIIIITEEIQNWFYSYLHGEIEEIEVELTRQYETLVLRRHLYFDDSIDEPDWDDTITADQLKSWECDAQYPESTRGDKPINDS